MVRLLRKSAVCPIFCTGEIVSVAPRRGKGPSFLARAFLVLLRIFGKLLVKRQSAFRVRLCGRSFSMPAPA